ncbi:MAG: hypothetical protein WBM00_02625 [Solirubrobacterales bacterium]
MSLREKIHQWSLELPLWQRDLLRRLASGPLSKQDEKEVLASLAGVSEAPAPRPLELSHLHLDRTDGEPVELRAIRDVQNINRLAPGQALCFSSGLNVVLGPTAAGKSGYARLLRRLGRSAGFAQVLPNVFDAEAGEAQQTASIQIAVSGEIHDIAVDLDGKASPALAALAVFDGACAQLYLSGPNVIEHVPSSLLLLRRMVEAQDLLADRLKAAAKEAQEGLPQLPDIDPETAAGRLLATITAETDSEEVARFASLSDGERAEMRELNAALAGLTSDQGSRLEAAARGRADAAAVAAKELEEAAGKLADERIEALGVLRARLDDASAAERRLAVDAFAGQPFAGTGQGPWREMWEAARRFVESGGRTFPSAGPDAACPLCQQDLDDADRKRMAKFEEFVRSNLRGQIATLAARLSDEVAALPDLSALRARVEANLAGAPEPVTAAAEEAVDILTTRAGLAARQAEGDGTEVIDVSLPALAPIRSYAEEWSGAAETRAALHGEGNRQQLIDRFAELRARNELAAALPSVRARISELERVDRLGAAVAQLGTAKISSTLRRLQQAAVTDRMRAAIADELRGVGLLEGRIKSVGKAAKGKSAVQLGLDAPGRSKLVEVLSDGEQRALALAFFFAESAVSASGSSIILDDPVALLDGERQEYVARRLVEEAQRRQVIVFSHDRAFVEMLRRAAEDAGQEVHQQTIHRDGNRAGLSNGKLTGATGSSLLAQPAVG